jgi:uncharacterized membrane protein YedE/YeeE
MATISITSEPAGRGATPARARRLAPWITLGLLLAFIVTWLVGLRQGLLFAVGIGYGAVLAGVSFGFTTGWRVWIRERDPTGLLAQFLAIALAMAVSIPLIARDPALSGAIGPVSWSLVIGALVFGAAMQVADGCGSGTLYKAGLGNPLNLATLPGFIAGSFLGAAQLDRWLALGSLPPLSLPQKLGVLPALALQLALLALLATWFWRRRRTTESNWRGRAIYLGAVGLAFLAVLNLVIAGQPWGIVYGLGLWGAKIATWLGADLTANAYWGRPLEQALIHAPLLTDVTSVTDLGLLFGAFAAAHRRGTAVPVVRARASQWVAAAVAGLALGYSSRLAFGCNVGAYFSGIASGSLHGWIWFAAAFAGSIAGVRLRAALGFAR